MISTGIIRRIDDLGRIVIPRELRKRAGIMEGMPIEFYFEKNKIFLIPHNSRQNAYSVGEQFVDMLDDVPEITKEDKNIIRDILKKIQ